MIRSPRESLRTDVRLRLLPSLLLSVWALPLACGGSPDAKAEAQDAPTPEGVDAGEPEPSPEEGTDGSAAADDDDHPMASVDGGVEGDSPAPDDGDVPLPDVGADPSDPATACEQTQAAPAELRRLTQVQYRNAALAIFDGLVTPSSNFPAPSGTPPTGYSTELGYENMSEQDVERATMAAEDVAVSVVDAIDELLPCASEADANQACVEGFLDSYARRAYKRPLDDAERQLLLAEHAAAMDDGFSFAEAVGVMVAHLMQAPQFLYVAEDGAEEPRPLNGFEMASRLSFLLWDSVPDDALLDLAASGGLQTPEDASREARRLLASSKADATLARFFREWTHTKRVSRADKSQQLFPEFDDALAASMNESFDRLVVYAVKNGRSLAELLSSSETFVDPTLAAFFGVETEGMGWQRIVLEDSHHAGLLTHPAWLASLAHSDDTSFVFRGRFIQQRLFCNDFGPPPPNAMSTEFDLPENPTAVERSMAFRSNASCSPCHSLLDPAGLAFEHFDAIGRYRETDSLGREIDASGTLVGASGGAIDFADHRELIVALSSDASVDECFARQIYRFATSHEETAAEECAVASILQTLDDTGGDIEAALLSVVATEAFRTREAP